MTCSFNRGWGLRERDPPPWSRSPKTPRLMKPSCRTGRKNRWSTLNSRGPVSSSTSCGTPRPNILSSGVNSCRTCQRSISCCAAGRMDESSSKRAPGSAERASPARLSFVFDGTGCLCYRKRLSTTLAAMKKFRDPALRVTLLPRDTNKNGSVFGGVILSHIDLAGAIQARQTAGPYNFVTVAMDKVVFHKPVFVGDVVSFYTETVRVGRTSITIKIDVEATRGDAQETGRGTEAEVVFVAVDKHWKPTPIKKK